MKVIFLDVDGVLNSLDTKERIEGYIFVSDDKIELLKEIVDQTGAKVVLSSTWRRGWYCKEHIDHPNESDRQDIRMFDALCEKLHEFNIGLLDYTDDFGLRGQEIDAWLNNWTGEPIESYVILDDMSGRDIRPHSRFLVQTSLGGGINKKHVQRAIEILNIKSL
ncbi:MAG: hypothetical protein IJ292_04560 [Clostridia bacterium]|nr:hypothetical protein [Clostridia bacterium]